MKGIGLKKKEQELPNFQENWSQFYFGRDLGPIPFHEIPGIKVASKEE